MRALRLRNLNDAHEARRLLLDNQWFPSIQSDNNNGGGDDIENESRLDHDMTTTNNEHVTRDSRKRDRRQRGDNNTTNDSVNDVINDGNQDADNNITATVTTEHENLETNVSNLCTLKEETFAVFLPF